MDRCRRSACLACFFFQAEDGIRGWSVTGVQTCALPIYCHVELLASAVAAYAVVGLGQKADLDDAAALDRVHDAADRLVARILVAADVNLRLRLPDRGLLDEREQRVAIGHALVVPVDIAVLV